MRNDIFHLHRYEEGASTLTQQLARGFFLTPERTYSRKVREAVISIILEHRFDKKQIFAMYANEIPLGQIGSFSIDGFGEASQDYFGKDVSQLDLAECALLAGLIQSPSRLNPFHHPERAIERRNLVLDSMVETGAITKDEAEAAKSEPLHLVSSSVDESEAPYFVDLVHDQLTQRLGDRDFNREGLRIYTSLDPDLQRVATQAVDSTIHIVDAQIDAVHARDKKLGKSYVYPQVALIALDPHTGQVLALVGGRNYGTSQVNHAVAHRPTGSIFKPFVYAAAFQTAVRRHDVARANQTLFACDHARRRAADLWRGHRLRVHAAQLRKRVLRRDDCPLGPDALGQQRNHQPGQHGGIRSRGRSGARCRHQERARHAVHGHRLLRRHAA